MKTRVTLLAGCVTLFAITQVSAQLYQDQMNSGAGWGENATTGDYLATFGYDYSADGIPEAPNSQIGDAATRGLKMEANLTGEATTFSVYPIGQNFVGSYQLRFDAWSSFGTDGTTEYFGGGIGYNNSNIDFNGGATGFSNADGGSANDWRAYNNDTYVPLGNGSSEPYVSFLPSVNGSTAGSPAFQWITWEINVFEGTVTMFIEKPDNSRLQLTSFASTVTDGNVRLTYADYFTSLGLPASETFGLVDNVVVSAIPEPTTMALVLIGGAGLLLRSRRRL